MNLLKTKLESLTKQNHIEILKILKSHREVVLNENKSGIFINMSTLPSTILLELQKYLEHVNYQNTLLQPAEEQMEYIKQTFYSEVEVDETPPPPQPSPNAVSFFT